VTSTHESSGGSGHDLVALVDVKKHFEVGAKGFPRRPVGPVKAVDGVSFAIREHEAFGLVGESGCGKSTIGRMLVGLAAPTAGRILFDGHDLHAMTRERMRGAMRNVQIVFQDPYGSLDPRMRVGRIISEPLRIANEQPRREIDARVGELLDCVGLLREHAERYPHEFSGGQRQRIAIARALALRPKFLVGDECVSALDISVKVQILDLLRGLIRGFGVTLLFISHDLSAVRALCDRIGVLYLGKLVEVARKGEFFTAPLHPYSQALLSALPGSAHSDRRRRIVLQGEVPSPMNPPSGCVFRTRCWMAQPKCEAVTPPLVEASPGRYVACHFVATDSRSALES
jgi:oligopeptide/dipeptide ABC transporter ATP-binding protein